MGDSEVGVDTGAMAAIVRARLFADAEPHRIGRFTVVARLGAGGMGVVYAAFDPELDRRVAIKLLFAHTDERGRLAREAQAMARLNHPNVAQVYEVGRHGDATYVAMEHVRGRTLRAWAQAAHVGLRERLAVLLQAGRGLAAAHAAGVIHRDFKPDNVIVGDDGRVRVLDFGLARIDGAQREHTGDGVAAARSQPSIDSDGPTPQSVDANAGTPAYMAPEQWRGEAIDARADVYAFCVTAWEILDGRRPFAGTSRDDPRALPSSSVLPRALERALRGGLAFDRDQRPRELAPILDALQRDPGAMRRRIVSAVGACIVAGSVFAWRQLAERSRLRACDAEAAAIADDWHPARGEAMVAGFAALGLPAAPDAAARTRARLDAFATAWSSARSAACLDQPARDETVACLDDARTELVVLLERLDAPTRELVPLSVSAAIGLPDPHGCSDPRSAAARQLAALDVDDRRRLVELAVLRETAAFDDALVAAQALRAESEARGSVGLGAAMLAESQALRDLGRHAEARPVAEDAYYAAGTAGDEFTALRAATALVDVVGYRMAQRERGEEWARVARMHVERLGLVDDPAEAALESRIAALLKDVDSEASLAAHRRALAIRQRNFGELHPAVATSYFDIGVGLADRGSIDEGIAALRHAIEIDEQVFGPDHPSVAKVLNSLGQMQSSQGDYDGALATLHRALVIDERSLGPEHESYAGTLISVANLDLRFGRYEQALDGYRRALAIVEEVFGPDHWRVADATAALANALQRTGDIDGALASHRRALAIQERALGPDNAKLAPLLGNLGILLLNTDHTDEGLALLRRSDAILSAHYGPDNDDRAVVLAAIASAETSRGHPEAALAPLEQALAIMERAGVAPDRRADAEFELARALLLTRGDLDRAMKLARTAAESWRAIGPPRAEWLGYAQDLIAEIEARRR